MLALKHVSTEVQGATYELVVDRRQRVFRFESNAHGSLGIYIVGRIRDEQFSQVAALTKELGGTLEPQGPGCLDCGIITASAYRGSDEIVIGKVETVIYRTRSAAADVLVAWLLSLERVAS